MKAVFLSKDLVFISRMRQAAARAGVEFEAAAEPDEVLEACRTATVDLLIVDLACAAGSIEQLVPRFRSLAKPPQRIIGYAAHVHEDWLASARAAGCDDVLTRGQFDRRMETILAAP